MDSREMGSVSEEVTVKDSSEQADAVKLVEMGEVSVETKGILRGLELGFTPRNY